MPATSSLPRYVIDASVAAKWHLQDEDAVAQADALLREFRDGRIDLIAPDCIRYEVAGAIRRAQRTGRLTIEDGRAAIAAFLRWHIPTVGSDALVLAAYDQSLRFACSIYDGLYLALRPP